MKEEVTDPQNLRGIPSLGALGVLLHLFAFEGRVATTHHLLDGFPDDVQEVKEALDELAWLGYVDLTVASIDSVETTFFKVNATGEIFFLGYGREASTDN